MQEINIFSTSKEKIYKVYNLISKAKHQSFIEYKTGNTIKEYLPKDYQQLTFNKKFVRKSEVNSEIEKFIYNDGKTLADTVTSQKGNRTYQNILKFKKQNPRMLLNQSTDVYDSRIQTQKDSKSTIYNISSQTQSKSIKSLEISFQSNMQLKTIDHNTTASTPIFQSRKQIRDKITNQSFNLEKKALSQQKQTNERQQKTIRRIKEMQMKYSKLIHQKKKADLNRSQNMAKVQGIYQQCEKEIKGSKNFKMNMTSQIDNFKKKFEVANRFLEIKEHIDSVSNGYYLRQDLRDLKTTKYQENKTGQFEKSDDSIKKSDIL